MLTRNLVSLAVLRISRNPAKKTSYRRPVRGDDADQENAAVWR